MSLLEKLKIWLEYLLKNDFLIVDLLIYVLYTIIERIIEEFYYSSALTWFSSTLNQDSLD